MELLDKGIAWNRRNIFTGHCNRMGVAWNVLSYSAQEEAMPGPILVLAIVTSEETVVWETELGFQERVS